MSLPKPPSAAPTHTDGRGQRGHRPTPLAQPLTTPTSPSLPLTDRPVSNPILPRRDPRCEDAPSAALGLCRTHQHVLRQSFSRGKMTCPRSHRTEGAATGARSDSDLNPCSSATFPGSPRRGLGGHLSGWGQRSSGRWAWAGPTRASPACPPPWLEVPLDCLPEPRAGALPGQAMNGPLVSEPDHGQSTSRSSGFRPGPSILLRVAWPCGAQAPTAAERPFLPTA